MSDETIDCGSVKRTSQCMNLPLAFRIMHALPNVPVITLKAQLITNITFCFSTIPALFRVEETYAGVLGTDLGLTTP